jgi:hypothetical protein
MDEERTTVVVQRYLDELADGSPAEPVIRALLDRAVRRLSQLCATLLHRAYPRLMRPPLNLQADEMLGAVVERLLKALREARPANVRQFFALAGQHMRWELNDMARRLDEQPAAVELHEGLAPAQASSGSGLTPGRPAHARRDRPLAGGRARGVRPGAHPGDEPGRGRPGAWCLGHDGDAPVESLPADIDRNAGRPSPAKG